LGVVWLDTALQALAAQAVDDLGVGEVRNGAVVGGDHPTGVPVVEQAQDRSRGVDDDHRRDGPSSSMETISSGRYTEIGQVGERRRVVGPACGDA
jgi:hypothetical protein